MLGGQKVSTTPRVLYSIKNKSCTIILPGPGREPYIMYHMPDILSLLTDLESAYNQLVGGQKK